MSIFLQIACQTIKRRLDKEESFDDILKDYSKLTTEQIVEIQKEMDHA